jgi:hypothetical protein
MGKLIGPVNVGNLTESKNALLGAAFEEMSHTCIA